jgi:hypothetical protein
MIESNVVDVVVRFEVSSPTKGGGDISKQRLRERFRSEMSPSRASKMTPLH